MKLNGVGRSAAVVRVNADVESQTGRQTADGERGLVGRHVASQRLSVTVVHLHDEPLAEAAVETGLTPDHQRSRSLVYHRAVFQAVRTACVKCSKNVI